MAAFVYPVFGKTPVDQVDTALVLQDYSADLVDAACNGPPGPRPDRSVLAWATVRGYRAGDNPASWTGALGPGAADR